MNRNIALCVIFSFITCGIYGIYWFIVLTDELKQYSGDNETASGGLAFVFTLISCNIYGWYWAYKRGENIDVMKSRQNIPSSNHAILFIILQALGLGIVNYCIMQNEINKMAAQNSLSNALHKNSAVYLTALFLCLRLAYKSWRKLQVCFPRHLLI